MIDFETDQAKVITKTENIRSLADQVERLENLNQEIEKKEKDLKQRKKDLEHISGEVIPTMMAEMGLSHLKLMDGSSVDVKPNYSANITIANREAAFNWLRNNGLGDIIKNDITVTFGMSEDNKATAYAVLARGQGYEPVQKVAVHTGTLKAVVRERTESGQDMPADLFNTFVGNQTKINRRN